MPGKDDVIFLFLLVCVRAMRVCVRAHNVKRENTETCKTSTNISPFTKQQPN